MAASITCQNCGTSAPQGTTFCPSCGEMLFEMPAPSAPTGPGTTSTTPVPEPQVVQVPRRPAPQQAPRGRTRAQVPPTQPPRSNRGQGTFGLPPRTQQLPPQSGPFGAPQGTFGVPQGRPVRVRRRGGCGTLLFRLLALVIGLPILFSLASRFLFGSGQESAAPAPQTTSTKTYITFAPTSAPATATTPAPSLTIQTSASTSPSSSSASSSTATTYPALTLTGRECRRTGTGPHAAVAAGNDATSCSFAESAQDAYLKADPATGQSVRITAWSQVRGQNVALQCTGDQPVKCVSAYGPLVYLYGGTASFR